MLAALRGDQVMVQVLLDHCNADGNFDIDVNAHDRDNNQALDLTSDYFIR